MSLLRNGVTAEVLVLRSCHVFGRNQRRADTFLDNPEVSLMHAVARWREGRWTLEDCSRNGTFIDNRALVRGVPVALAAGQELSFGRGCGSTWRVIDIAPPSALLLAVDDPTREPLVLGPHNLLPTSDAPELCIYERGTGVWVLERDGRTHKLADGDTLSLGAELHRFLASAPMADTHAAAEPVVEPPRLVFRLSLDEEHTWLDVHCGTTQVALGERSHHYCLATLARRRLADHNAGFEPSAQGWLANAELARMLGMEVTHLNIQVFRAREQLMTALPAVAALSGLIERRRGELRLGEFAFDVLRGAQLEGRFRPSAAKHSHPELT